MSGYASSSSNFGMSNAAATEAIAVKAGTSAVRLAKIESCTSTFATNPQWVVMSVYRYTGATLSGGTALTVGPLRAGAPAATASVKLNPTISGTSQLITTQIMPGGGSNYTFQFAFDFTVAPGDALYVSCAPGASYNVAILAVEFEELHLARST